MSISPSQLVMASDLPQNSGEGGLLASLSDIANGVILNVANKAASRLEDSVGNAPRSSNTQPVPDITAAAATPAASSFLDAKAFGVSIPLLLLGAGALLIVLLKRK